MAINLTGSGRPLAQLTIGQTPVMPARTSSESGSAKQDPTAGGTAPATQAGATSQSPPAQTPPPLTPAADAGHGSGGSQKPAAAVAAAADRQKAVVAAGPSISQTPVPAATAMRRSAPISTPEDTEFLPSALEILVTPPSPIAIWLMLTICTGTLAAIGWGFIGKLDIHAVAPGKIQPNGRTKVVQPLEPGRVVAIRVEGGAKVDAGQLLLELDPTETTADREALARDLESSKAETARRRAAIASASQADLGITAITFSADVGAAYRQRETAVLGADIGQLRSQIASLRSQYEERRATKQRLQASIDARERLLVLARERVAMRQDVEIRGAGSRAQIIEALQQLEQQQTLQAAELGQLAEMDAAMLSTERKIEETRSQFIADQTQKMVEMERKGDRLEQELVKAKSKRDRTELRSPLAGTVQQLTVSTVGQVVTTGQSLLTIVPLDGALEVEANIANKDIGFVKVGQEAVIKVEAFPFTRYGTITAQVIKISRDAVDDRENQTVTDAATAAKQGASPGGRLQNLVFPATLRLDKRTIMVDGEPIALTPGMAVTVEIKTGTRRAIDYVFSPLIELWSGSVSER